MTASSSTPQVGSRDHTVKWFDETVTVPPQARELLENYRHIPAAEVQDHVVTLRNKAWEVWPYPCLGQFRFLELNLANRADIYPQLLSRLRGGDQRFLDVGCCLGQDIRKLVYDGVPSENLAGIELEAGFVELGYELFRDRDTLKSRFAVGTILDEDWVVLKEWEGQYDVVQLGMILHLFTWEEQARVFEHAIRLLKREGDVAIIGQATGNLDGIASPSWRKNTFRHNAETFGKLISEVERSTGTRWEVTASLDDGLSVHDGKRTWDDPKTRRLLFEVRRKQE
ncbi:methyltransferase [Coniochaeta ligniaria NRRL 30616]|uniref:Methyltransferase n=1 Tax=Coniochaeta ligniaria NRRL 30616 TaxID=1408157 RepID=A0A1J7J0J1_9PEZI|nr:methyltransferase [Coniochaeta ligniaria NRRL 30616]